MANYNLVVSSKFSPFTFDEILKPAVMATEAHLKLEELYGELATKASIWENMANLETDPIAYSMYKGFANDLESKANLLAKEGLNVNSRKALLDMRARYSKEITPIELVYAARLKLAELQQQAELQDPTLMFSRRAATTSLDKYLQNPLLAYDAYSGKLITALVALAASTLAKEIQNNPRKWRSILGNSYYETIIQKGIPSDIISKFLYNADDIIYNNLNPETVGIPLELSNKLRDILEAPLASSGIRDWKNNMSKSNWEALVSKVNNYARQGLWSAVGETQYQTLQNPDHLNPLLELLYEKAKEEALRNSLFIPISLEGNPYNLDVRIDPSKSATTYNSFKQYFDINGRLTKEGFEEYNRKDKSYKSADGAGSYAVESDSPFKIYMDNLNGGKPVTTLKVFGPWASKRFGELYKSLGEALAKTDINADTYRNVAFDVQFKDLDSVKQALTSGKVSGASLPIYEYTKEGYRQDGYINLHDTKFKNATFAGEYGILGNFIVITDTKGKLYRVPLAEVNKSLDNAISTTLSLVPSLYYKNKDLKYTMEELNKPFYHNGKITTINNEINKLLNSARNNFGAAFEQIKTAPHEVKGGLN